MTEQEVDVEVQEKPTRKPVAERTTSKAAGKKTIEVINVREEQVPIFDPINKCNVYPGSRCDLPMDLAKKFMRLGYVEFTD